MSLITLKSGQVIDDVVAVAKGLIEPEDLRAGGVLTAQGASTLISLVFATPFLERITTIRMSKLTREVDVMDILRRQLVRVPQGSEPSVDDLTGVGEHGCKLRALDAQLFASLTLDFLRDNADNPNIQKEIEKSFETVLSNDIVDLGFNGIADDGEGATQEDKFIRLNKGWLQIVREAAAAKKPNIDPAVDGWVASLEAIKEQQDERAKATSVFFMNGADADKYGREINANVVGHETKTGDPARRFEGQEIVTHPNIPVGSILYTPPKNLVFGLHTRIERSRKYHDWARALRYVFDKQFDFEVAVKQYAVLGE